MNNLTDLTIFFLTDLWINNNFTEENLYEYVTDDFTYESPFTDKTGKEWVFDHSKNIKYGFSDISIEFKEIFEKENKTATLVKFSGIHFNSMMGIEPSFKNILVDFFIYLEFEGKRVKTMKTIYDLLEIKNQLIRK